MQKLWFGLPIFLMLVTFVEVGSQQITAQDIQDFIQRISAQVLLGSFIAFYATSATTLGLSWGYATKKSKENIEADLIAVGLLEGPAGRSASSMQSIFNLVFEEEIVTCFMSIVCQLQHKYPDGIRLDQLDNPEKDRSEEMRENCPVAYEGCPDMDQMFQFWSAGISMGQHLHKMVLRAMS